jgi:hypothetical protein
LLPSEFFACAKMLDTFRSQDDLSGRKSCVVEEEIIKLLREKMSWSEACTALYYK